MGNISKLLKWHKPLSLKNPKGEVMMDVWIRILDDDDLQKAYREARLASSKRRKELKDPTTKEYMDDIAIVDSADREQCMELIRAAKGNNFTAEAFSTVIRPDLPKFEEVAVDPDAPTLEEQENFDKAIFDVEKGYREALDKYVEQRTEALDAEMVLLSDEELRAAAKDSTADVVALALFMARVAEEKAWRSVWEDRTFCIRGFDNYEEWEHTESGIKDQIREAYSMLETNPDDLKN